MLNENKRQKMTETTSNGKSKRSMGRKYLVYLGLVALLSVVVILRANISVVNPNLYSAADTKQSMVKDNDDSVDDNDDDGDFIRALYKSKPVARCGFGGICPATTRLRIAYAVLILDISETRETYVRVLKKGLMRAKREGRYDTGHAPLIALIPPQLESAKDCLLEWGFHGVEILNLLNPCPQRDGRYGPVYTKLGVFGMTQYDRLVVIDADMVVLQNIEELFEYTQFAAAHDWPRGVLPIDRCGCTSTSCVGSNKLMPGFSWIKDQFLNGGLLVVQPNSDQSKVIWKDMVKTITPWNLANNGMYSPYSCQPGEQRFLNDFFYMEYHSRVRNFPAGLKLENRDFFPLPAEIYNIRHPLAMSAPQLLVSPKIFHYVDGKPTMPNDPSVNPSHWFYKAWFRDKPNQLSNCTMNLKHLNDGHADFRKAVEPADYYGIYPEAYQAARERLCGQSMKDAAGRNRDPNPFTLQDMVGFDRTKPPKVSDFKSTHYVVKP